MSTQITDRPPTAEETQRRGHMAALAVAEQIVILSPLVPTDVKVTCAAFDNGQPSVNVYFHDSAEGVEQLAEVLGATAGTRPFQKDDPRPYTEAQLMVSGVPVKAWALLDGVADEASAVAA
ncbi:hypothetical protein [Streptomyces hygroscopicus]|uniref:hypothetical protein n=1 Tax=Streptomyces hygroscopicus TaxID=1912 RepID=UPI0037AB2273